MEMGKPYFLYQLQNSHFIFDGRDVTQFSSRLSFTGALIHKYSNISII